METLLSLRSERYEQQDIIPINQHHHHHHLPPSPPDSCGSISPKYPHESDLEKTNTKFPLESDQDDSCDCLNFSQKRYKKEHLSYNVSK